MTSININIIKETLLSLENKFPRNELADFSLKMKNEILIRNKLKEIWSQRYPELNFFPEYKRVDLAVLKDWNVDTLIELKALYTIDGFKKNPDFFRYDGKASLLKDFDKNFKILDQNPNIEQYQIIIATHPHAPVPKQLKYSTQIQDKHYYKNIDNMLNVCTDNIKNLFDSSHFIIEECKIDAGISFNIPVELYFWIVKKV